MKSIKKKQNKIRPWLKSLLGCRASTTIFSPKGPHSFPFSLAPVVTSTLLSCTHSAWEGMEREKGYVLSMGVWAPDIVEPQFCITQEPMAPLAFQWREPSLMYHLGWPSP